MYFILQQNIDKLKNLHTSENIKSSILRIYN